MKPLISVIVPIFNSALWLRRCLSSIQNNTYRNLEIICVDDGSTDESPAILREHAAQDARIILLEQENSGVGVARNAGLEAANGEYIFFMDSDDWLHSRFFEILQHTLEETGACMAVCDYLETEATEQEEYAVNTPAVKTLPTLTCFSDRKLKIHVWDRLYRRSSIGAVRFCTERNCAEDYLFNAAVLSAHPEATVTYVQAPLYYYFQRQGSLAGQIGLHSQIIVSRQLDIMANQRGAAARNSLAAEIIIRALSLRREAYLYRDRENYALANMLLKKYRLPMLRAQQTGLLMKLLCLLCTFFPSGYHLYAILRNPGLASKERAIRKSIKNTSHT